MRKSIKILSILGLGFFLLGNKAATAQTDSTFNYTDSIVKWTVPCGVNSVTITAIGATGGIFIGYTPVGGNGAKMVGTFAVTSGSVLKILVGQAGQSGSGGGGGGGGTFVTDALNNPLIVAGGGGGVSAQNNTFTSIGIDAVTTNNGVNGNSALGSNPANYGVGGTGGSGATNSGPGGPCAGNGGGLLTNGTAYSCCSLTTWGYAFVNGGAGGIDGGCFANGQGGFGGGGSGGYTGGGGGGGYSGGGGSWDQPTNGGGGGSYNGGTSQTNTAAFNASGNGQVIIQYTASSNLAVSGNVISNVSCN
ncbi:MAG TPA: hypothetical protein VNZ45_09255, partial [Bacteroidia bacterium]|nr:hypothetical protein [Bacteroidia bacterium]